MTAYNPDEVERLIAEAREDDQRMPDAPWDHAPVEPPAGSCDIRGPECDCRETEPAAWCWMHDGIAEFVPVDVADAIIRQRNNLRAMADQLEAARAEIERIPDLEAAIRYEIEKRDRFERERNAARWADDTRRKACEALITERDAARAETDQLRKLVDPVELHRTVPQAAFHELDMGTTWKTDRAEAFAGRIAKRVVDVSASERSDLDRLRSDLASMRPVLDAVTAWYLQAPTSFGHIVPDDLRVAMEQMMARARGK